MKVPKDDLYIQYWYAVLDGYLSNDVRKKLRSEIAARLRGIRNNTKCPDIGAKCPWPRCTRAKRLDKGYCAP